MYNDQTTMFSFSSILKLSLLNSRINVLALKKQYGGYGMILNEKKNMENYSFYGSSSNAFKPGKNCRKVCCCLLIYWPEVEGRFSMTLTSRRKIDPTTKEKLLQLTLSMTCGCGLGTSNRGIACALRLRSTQLVTDFWG